MKKCIITLNLIFYIIFLNQWNLAESHPTSSSSGKSSTDTKESKDTVALDIEKSKDTDEFNYKKNGDFRTYTPKSNYVFNKVVKKNLDIWTSKPNDHGLKVVLMGSGNDEKHLAILLKSHNFVLLRKSGKNQPWGDITSTRYDITNLKFFDENDTQLSKTDYTVDLVDLSFTYTFNTGVKCKKIKYGDVFLWNHTQDTDFSQIKSISLGLPKNKFILKNQSDETKELSKPAVAHVVLDIQKTQSTDEFEYTDQSGVVTYTPKTGHVFNKVSKGTKDIWESKNDIFGTLVRIMTSDNVKYLAILLDNNMFKLFNEESGDWKDITNQRVDIKKLKFLGESDTELKSSDYTVTLVDLSYTYVFKDANTCKKIKLGDDEVWNHTEDSKFADIKSFSLDLTSNSFFVKNQSDQSKKIEKEFKAETSNEATKVALDIDKTQSTNEFEYTDQSGVVTYKPKDNHVFNKVSKGTTIIWESKDDVCGTLVRTMKSDAIRSKTRLSSTLAILLSNDTFKFFIQMVGNQPWKDLTSERHDITKLKFLGENDTELKSSDYKVDLIDYSYTYMFNDGIKCKKIKYGDEEVWKHDDDPKFSDIKSFSFGLASNKFILKNQSDETKKLDFKASTPTQSTGSPASQTQSGTPAT